MMNSVFALAGNGMTWGERLSMAGIVSLQGMLTIFLVLAILWGSIEIMHHVVHKEKKEKAPSEKSEVASSLPAQDDRAVAAAIAAAMAASDDSAVVAAITAAVSAALAEDGYTGSFRVVSFKRVGLATRKKN